MAVDLLRTFSAKWGEIVLLGDRVTPDLAYEIIRRTNLDEKRVEEPVPVFRRQLFDGPAWQTPRRQLI